MFFDDYYLSIYFGIDRQTGNQREERGDIGETVVSWIRTDNARLSYLWVLAMAYTSRTYCFGHMIKLISCLLDEICDANLYL